MALLTWWQGDPRPALRALDNFRVEVSDNASLLAALSGYDVHEADRRLCSRHRPYVAFIGAIPVAYGWEALEGAAIGEPGVQVTLSSEDRYLWDFVTLPEWRGRGIYPCLLQAILKAEERSAERFWIIHAPENGASQAGIEKAGFRPVGELSFRRGGGTGLVPSGLRERAAVGAAMLGVPLINDSPTDGDQEQPLAPCWRCVLDARQREVGDAAVACWWNVPDMHELSHQSACRCE